MVFLDTRVTTRSKQTGLKLSSSQDLVSPDYPEKAL
jgi:hypothetical protein